VIQKSPWIDLGNLRLLATRSELPYVNDYWLRVGAQREAFANSQLSAVSGQVHSALRSDKR